MQREWEQRAQSDAFGYIGRGYAETDAKFWASGETDLTDLILRDIDLRPSASVVEIGCGVGRLVRPLSKRVAHANGVDIAPGMISRGRELLNDVPNAHLHATDGSLEVIEDNSQDFVFSFVVFQHIPSKQAINRYIRETARVLKPGGVFKFQVDGRARPFWKGADTWLGVWFKPNEIRNILTEAGFSVIDTWGESTQYYWLTARVESANPTALATARHPTWNRDATLALLARLSLTSTEVDSEAFINGTTCLRDHTRSFLRDQRHTTPEEFIEAAFRAILNREPDTEGRKFYLRQLSQNVSRSYLIDCLLSSAELRTLVRL
jgi:SAM-dependent methyltransferase